MPIYKTDLATAKTIDDVSALITDDIVKRYPMLSTARGVLTRLRPLLDSEHTTVRYEATGAIADIRAGVKRAVARSIGVTDMVSYGFFKAASAQSMAAHRAAKPSRHAFNWRNENDRARVEDAYDAAEQTRQDAYNAEMKAQGR
jgi:hypothetical protein